MENKISLEIGMYKKGVKANFKSTGGITLITLVITIILHYYYGMKYSNSNGFLKAIV